MDILDKANCVYEKKKWISITGLCNNNCLFCLDSSRPDKYHKKKDDIKSQIYQARQEGNTKLILSGGDPTIHPNLAEFIYYAKEIGFDKVQIITNGRMFALKKFTNKLIEAGIDEVTLSIHGFNSLVHDTLTNVSGSFKQIIKGLINIRNNPYNKKIIINTDTCITKINYKQIPKIVKFIYEKLGIDEINLMTMVPQGNAWKNKDEIILDYKLQEPYIKKVIDYSKEKKIVLWLSRFPSKYLEGYEQYIEDPYKLIDEVRGRLHAFEKNDKELFCQGVMCDYCSLKSICQDLLKAHNVVENKLNNKKKSEDYFKIELNENNVLNLDKIVKDIINEKRYNKLEFYMPTILNVLEYKKEVLEISSIVEYLDEIDFSYFDKVKLVGIPLCVIKKQMREKFEFGNYEVDYLKYISFKEDIKDNYTVNFLKLASDLASKLTIKMEKCDNCSYQEKCLGISPNYLRIYSSKVLKPFVHKEIRVNLDCNQNCVFCNTDNRAENIITDNTLIKEKLLDWSNNGVNYLTITGREPTLRSDLIELIDLAKRLNYDKIELQTNAVKCANLDYVKKIVDAGTTQVFVSVHAHNEDISKLITRAPNTFDKTVQGILNLKLLGVDVIINLVINKYNYEYLLDIVQFINKFFSPEQIVLSYVSPVGECKNNLDVLPKISDVKPHLISALNFLEENDIKFNIASRCGIPICQVEKYKKYHDEYMSSIRFKNENNKIKSSGCIDCQYYDLCSGVWQDYVSIYGIEEIEEYLKNGK